MSSMVKQLGCVLTFNFSKTVTYYLCNKAKCISLISDGKIYYKKEIK